MKPVETFQETVNPLEALKLRCEDDLLTERSAANTSITLNNKDNMDQEVPEGVTEGVSEGVSDALGPDSASEKPPVITAPLATSEEEPPAKRQRCDDCSNSLQQLKKENLILRLQFKALVNVIKRAKYPTPLQIFAMDHLGCLDYVKKFAELNERTWASYYQQSGQLLMREDLFVYRKGMEGVNCEQARATWAFVEEEMRSPIRGEAQRYNIKRA